LNTGSLLQTKYYLSNSSSKTAIIRRHHPLYDQQLELLSVGKTTVVVRLPDGSSMKIPRHWIDVDGSTCAELVGESEISLQGLKELLRLFIVLRERIGNDSEMIAAVQSNAEGGDDETKMFGISRSRVSRSVVGDVPGTRQRRGHTAACAADGSCIGGADSSVKSRQQEAGGA
jgi:hypothetical protein